MLDGIENTGADGPIGHFFLFNLTSLRPETRLMMTNYLIQTLLGLISTSVLRFHFDDSNHLTKVLTVSHLMPILLSVVGLPRDVVNYAIHLSLLVPSVLVGIAVYSVFGGGIRVIANSLRTKRFKSLVIFGYSLLIKLELDFRQFVNNFGLNTFLEAEWTRIKVPNLLRTFWLTRSVT